jgi:Uma2 family endonuclease
MDALTAIRKRFTVVEYQQMAETGILSEDDRLELLEGEIVEMAALGPQHAACVDRLTQRLPLLVQGRAIVRIQNPVRVGERSQPQPDVALLQPRDDFYAGGHPEPEDVLLLIEVSESSLAYDRDVKLALYARAGIVEVWLVALLPQVVEIYRSPSENGYGEKRTMRRGDSLSPLHLPDVVLRVDEMLGGRG